MAVSGKHCHSRGQTQTSPDRASTARLMRLHDPHPSIVEPWTTPKHRPTIRSTHYDRSYQPMFCPIQALHDTTEPNSLHNYLQIAYPTPVHQPQPVGVYGQSSCNPSRIRAGTHLSTITLSWQHITYQPLTSYTTAAITYRNRSCLVAQHIATHHSRH